MGGRTLRARAPVNYTAEGGGTNTPGWLKSKTTPRVLSSDAAVDAALTAVTDKENKPNQQKHENKSSPTTTGMPQPDQSNLSCT